MKDKRGCYYYPFPQNRKIRMYVRKNGSEICFRLWNPDDSKLWEEHDWVPYEAIKQATGIYRGGNFDPNKAYDIDIARTLIKEHGGKQPVPRPGL